MAIKIQRFERGINMIRSVFTILAIQGLFGCSFMFTEGPPPDHGEKASFDCSESRWPPNLDASQAVGNAGFSVYSLVQLAQSDDSDPQNTNHVIGVLSGIAFSALHIASARAGYKRVRECRQAKQEAFYFNQIREEPREAPQTNKQGQANLSNKQQILMSVQDKVLRCGEKRRLKIVKVRFTIASDGTILSAKASKQDNVLAFCLRGAFHGLIFPATHDIQTIEHVFRRPSLGQ